MSLNLRRALAAVFIIFFLILAPLLVLWSSGFRWNPKKWSWQQTGSLSMETIPAGATISLNGVQLNQKTPTVINSLLPDLYDVRLEKEGHLQWSERVEIVAGKTIIGKNILLLPEKISRENEQTVEESTIPPKTQEETQYEIAQGINESTKQIVRHFPNSQKTEIVTSIPNDSVEILDIMNDAVTLLKNKAGGLVIGSIQEKVFTEYDTLLDVRDYQWNDKKTTVTVAAGLELLQYNIRGAQIQKTLITRSSHPFERVLPLPEVPYFFVEQENQIKIIEQSALDTKVISLLPLLENERIVAWQMDKKLQLTVWTKEQDKLYRFEIALGK